MIHYRIMLLFLISCFVGNAATARHIDTSTILLKLNNDARVSQKLMPLDADEKLNSLALEHSQEMAFKKKMSHEGYNERRLSYKETTTKFLSSFGENVARNRKTLKLLMEAWLASTTHRHNLLGNYNHTGFGWAADEDGNIYYTQLFALIQD